MLALMLGDTSMGMIDGYFGPRRLNPIGLTEHEGDRAWVLDRGRSIGDARIDDVRWRGEHEGRLVWVLLNSGSCGAYAFNLDPDTLAGVHSYRQPAGSFPVPGGTFARESLPGEMTWARAYLRGDRLWMDVGRGEVVALPAAAMSHAGRTLEPAGGEVASDHDAKYAVFHRMRDDLPAYGREMG